ncbi:MAG: hypothetical protein IKM70_02145 [Firmicutes bacterium]|nr:hypothetical protein [Bacillota bacterium]
MTEAEKQVQNAEATEQKDEKTSFSWDNQMNDLKELNWKWKLDKGTIFVIAAVVFALTFYFLIGDISSELRDDALVVQAQFKDEKVIPYESINNLEYRYSHVYGEKIGAFESNTTRCGTFENHDLGTFNNWYTNYVYTATLETILVFYDNGRNCLVFNLPTAEETQAFYLELAEKAGFPAVLPEKPVIIPDTGWSDTFD